MSGQCVGAVPVGDTSVVVGGATDVERTAEKDDEYDKLPVKVALLEKEDDADGVAVIVDDDDRETDCVLDKEPLYEAEVVRDQEEDPLALSEAVAESVCDDVVVADEESEFDVDDVAEPVADVEKEDVKEAENEKDHERE